MTIPALIGGKQAKLTADFIDYEIPLLLNKDSVKKTNAMIDFKNDIMTVFQKTEDIIHTYSGHYDILLNNFIKKDEFMNHQISNFCSYLKHKYQEQRKIVVTLHRRFAHLSSDKLIELLKLNNIIKNINVERDICTR